MRLCAHASDLVPGSETIEVDTSHNLMVTEPKKLAEILVERCQRYHR